MNLPSDVSAKTGLPTGEAGVERAARRLDERTYNMGELEDDAKLVARAYLASRRKSRRLDSLTCDIKVIPGTPIDIACHDLILFADFMGMVVTATFNEVTLMAHPGGDAKVLEQNWRDEQESDRPHKIAVSYLRDWGPSKATPAPQVGNPAEASLRR